jgi:hypothetical protein
VVAQELVAGSELGRLRLPQPGQPPAVGAAVQVVARGAPGTGDLTVDLEPEPHCRSLRVYCVDVTEQPAGPAEWLTLPDVAERLGIPVNRVHQLVRERSLIAVRENGVLRIPADFITENGVLKHLPGILTVLYDAGYNEAEALRWLYTADDSLPGTPAQALGGNRATEVKRRAQALGF